MLIKLISDRVVQTLLLATAVVMGWMTYDTSVAALQLSRIALCEVRAETYCDDPSDIQSRIPPPPSTRFAQPH
jgi:hypothetical protein